MTKEKALEDAIARVDAYLAATHEEFKQRLVNSKFPEDFDGGVFCGPITKDKDDSQSSQ